MDDELRLTNLGRADESILFQRTRNGGLAIEIEEPWADREGGNGVTAWVLLTSERVKQLKAWLDETDACLAERRKGEE